MDKNTFEYRFESKDKYLAQKSKSTSEKQMFMRLGRTHLK